MTPERQEPAKPFGDYVRVRMTVWSEVDTDILLDGEYITSVDHASGFDYASANVTISPSSRLTFKSPSFELTYPVIRFIDPEKRVLEARIGTERNCDVSINREQKLAAMGTADDVPNLTEELLTNVKKSVRYAAANRLGYIGDRSAVPALLEALQSDPDPYALACVATALGRIGDVSVIPALQQAFDAYEGKASYGYMFEAALRDLEFLRRRDERGTHKQHILPS
jgi:HEAT repeats